MESRERITFKGQGQHHKPQEVPTRFLWAGSLTRDQPPLGPLELPSHCQPHRPSLFPVLLHTLSQAPYTVSRMRALTSSTFIYAHTLLCPYSITHMLTLRLYTNLCPHLPMPTLTLIHAHSHRLHTHPSVPTLTLTHVCSHRLHTHPRP